MVVVVAVVVVVVVAQQAQQRCHGIISAAAAVAVVAECMSRWHHDGTLRVVCITAAVAVNDASYYAYSAVQYISFARHVIFKKIFVWQPWLCGALTTWLTVG